MIINKKNILIISLILLTVSCATIRDIEQKKETGKSIVIFYDYNWEKVYNAIHYIGRHSENMMLLTINKMDFAKEEKAIWFNDNLFHEYYKMLGIFFVPINEYKTKVEFVKANSIEKVAVYQKMIDQIIDESKYYLENGSEAYKEYTHQNYLKEKAEIKDRIPY